MTEAKQTLLLSCIKRESKSSSSCSSAMLSLFAPRDFPYAFPLQFLVLGSLHGARWLLTLTAFTNIKKEKQNKSSTPWPPWLSHRTGLRQDASSEWLRASLHVAKQPLRRLGLPRSYCCPHETAVLLLGKEEEPPGGDLLVLASCDGALLTGLQKWKAETHCLLRLPVETMRRACLQPARDRQNALIRPCRLGQLHRGKFPGLAFSSLPESLR